VSTGHLVALIDLSSVSNPDTNGLGHARLKIVAIFLRQDTYVDHLAVLTVGNAKAGVFYITRLLTKDGSQKLLFSG
jgi:hypothetical protein